MRNRILVICCVLAVVVLPLGATTQSALAYSFTDDVEKVVLDNGLTLLLKENPAFDIVALSLVSRVGSIHDPEGLEGLTYLTQRNMVSGTANRSALEIVTELESLGVQLQTAASYDYSAVLLQSTPATFEASLDVLLDLLENSTFPESGLERERQLSLATLQSLYDDPVNAIVLAYYDLFYQDHPYRYSPYGSAAGLSSIQQEHLVNWCQYIFQPENIVISVVGNINTDEIIASLSDRFGGWQSGWAGSPIPREQVSFVYGEEDKQIVINQPTQAAFLVIGYPAPGSFDKDNAAMAVINSVLGDGMSSRLFTEIRDKRGLAYTVMSLYDERTGPSSLLTFLATDPQNVDEARKYILAELQRFSSEGLTQEEIDRIAAQKQGTYLIQNETNLNQGLQLAVNELTGRGYQWVDEYVNLYSDVSPQDIQEAALKYFQNYTEVLITP